MTGGRGGSVLTVKPKNYRNKVTNISVFPMYGLWNGKTTFKSTKQLNDSFGTQVL